MRRFAGDPARASQKRTWVSDGIARDWHSPAQGRGEEFLRQATHVKNIWVLTKETGVNHHATGAAPFVALAILSGAAPA
ncbi:MAG: hypothetical protein R3A79_01140 [Nannocystaceae bacterium]